MSYGGCGWCDGWLCLAIFIVILLLLALVFQNRCTSSSCSSCWEI